MVSCDRNSKNTYDRELSQSATSGPRVSSKNRSALLQQVLERRMERGQYAYHRGDYSEALFEFEHAAKVASFLTDHSRYVNACTFILRILAEQEEFEKIEKIEAHVLRILSSAEAQSLDLKLKSHAHYVLGICSCYQDSRHELAVRRFHEAIDFALLAENREALAAPLYGAATVHYACGRYEEALRELDRLSVLLSCLNLPDLRSASSILRAMVNRNVGLLEAALESAWQAFESLKHHPHLVLYLHTLCVLGTIYTLKGEFASARLYLDLADRSLKRKEFPRIARLVDEALGSLGRPAQTPAADLVFETQTGILIEKNKGEIRFDGQFILRDLLRAFLENPGKVFTKEELVRDVWREAYDPRIHDNKIYVTIKRLRGLLETETGTTDYILRAKNGYCLNPQTRVLINDKQTQPETTE